MRCPNCGKETEDARFCPACGTKLEGSPAPLSPPEPKSSMELFGSMESGDPIRPGAFVNPAGPAAPESPDVPVPADQNDHPADWEPPQPFVPGSANAFPPPPAFSQAPQWQPIPPKKPRTGRIVLIVVLSILAAIAVLAAILNAAGASRSRNRQPATDLPSISLVEEVPETETAMLVPDEAFGCSYKVPADWQKEERENGALYSLPAEDLAFFSITVEALEQVPALDKVSVRTAYAQEVGAQVEGYEKVSVARADIDGKAALAHTFTALLNDREYRCETYVFPADNGLVTLLLCLPAEMESNHLMDTFAAIRSSAHCASIEGAEAAGPSASSEPASSASGSPAAAPEKNPASAPAPGSSWTGPGMYKVGKELPAGTYYLECTESFAAYYAVYTDSSGDFDSLIANDNVDTFSFLTVSDGQYLEITRGRVTPQEQVPAIGPKNGKYGPGTYRVGVDIPAGEYNVKSDGTLTYAYYAVLSSVDGALGNIVSNDNFETNAYVTVSEGQYLNLSGAYIDGE